MYQVEDHEKMAEQIRTGNLPRMDITAVLDKPFMQATISDLPVLTIVDAKNVRWFSLKQSHADVNRGAAKAGEKWKLWINRFGELFLVEKVADKPPEPPQTGCSHKLPDGNSAYLPSFEGGDTYRCSLCRNKIDVTEDD